MAYIGMTNTEYQRQWRHKNRERVCANKRSWRKRNHSRIIAQEREYRRKNADKLRIRNREWRRNNPEKGRDHELRFKYGSSLAEYNFKYKKQKGRCKVCGGRGNKKGKRKLGMDHNHKTGQVRDLLCFRCNAGLGSFQDSATLLMAAASYLENWADTEKIR